MNTKKLNLKQNILWNSVGNFIFFFFQWLLTYITTIILGFANAGIFSIAISLSNVVNALGTYGIRNFQVSDLDSKYNDKTYIITRLYSCILSIILCLIYLLVIHYDPYTLLCVLIYNIFKLSESYTDVFHGIFQKRQRMDIIGKSFIIKSVVTFTSFVLTALITKNLLISIIIMTISSYLVLLFYDYKKSNSFVKYKNEKFNYRNMKLLLLETTPIALYYTLSNLLPTIPKLVLENKFGQELLGFYSSIAIPTVIIQVIASYIFIPLVGVFSEHYKEKRKKEFIKLLIITISLIVGMSIVAMIGGHFLGEFCLKILFGDKIIPYVYLFVPALLVASLYALTQLFASILIVFRKQKSLLVTNIISILFCLITSPLFITSYEASGVNYATIATLVLACLIMLSIIIYKIKKGFKI